MSVHAKIEGHTFTVALWQAVYRGKICMRGSVELTKRAQRACGFHHARFADRTNAEAAEWVRIQAALARWARANVATLEVYSNRYLLATIDTTDTTTNGGPL
jgi:hypothetical protein